MYVSSTNANIVRLLAAGGVYALNHVAAPKRNGEDVFSQRLGGDVVAHDSRKFANWEDQSEPCGIFSQHGLKGCPPPIHRSVKLSQSSPDWRRFPIFFCYSRGITDSKQDARMNGALPPSRTFPAMLVSTQKAPPQGHTQMNSRKTGLWSSPHLESATCCKKKSVSCASSRWNSSSFNGTIMGSILAIPDALFDESIDGMTNAHVVLRPATHFRVSVEGFFLSKFARRKIENGGGADIGLSCCQKNIKSPFMYSFNSFELLPAFVSVPPLEQSEHVRHLVRSIGEREL